MPKLLIATTVPVTLQAFLMPYVRHFRNLGWTVAGVAQGLPNCEMARGFDRVHDIEWSRRLLSRANFTEAVRTIGAILRRGRYDVVHTHTAIASLILRFAAAQVPEAERPSVIYTAHGFHFNSGGNSIQCWGIELLERWASRYTDFLVTMNREDEAVARTWLPAAQVVYMPGVGVDVKHFARGAVGDSQIRSAREAFNLSGGMPVAVMIAEFSRRKRHQDVVAALPLMRNRSLQVVFAGAGPLLEQTRALASRLGVADRIRFAGYQQDVRPLLAIANCAVLPSSLEGLPRSVMEAMCFELPVVGTDIRGTRDLLSSGAGKLYPLGDTRQLADLLDWVVENPEESARMGQRARNAARAYEIGEVIAEHERLYARALYRRASRRTSNLLSCTQAPAGVSLP